jgi:hypothetical protein
VRALRASTSRRRRSRRPDGSPSGHRSTFVESDVYALDDHALGEFDIVHTSYGVLSWLPHLDRWAEIVAAHLAPGGLFHLVENHPFVMMLDDDGRTSSTEG